MFTKLMKRMEKITSASHPTASSIVPTAPVATAEFVTNSLSARLPEFVYDLDSAKARLIVSKLDAITYARFTNHILPKRAYDDPLTKTVAALKGFFGHNTSVLTRRYAYLKTQRNEESLSDYTGLANQRHAMTEFNEVTPEQMKCLVWICGLVARKMPMSLLPKLALSRHSSGCRSPRTIKCTARQRRGFAKETKSPSLCFRRSGHKRGLCKNFSEKKKRNPKQKRKSANTVTIASTHAGVAVNRIQRRVQIDEKTVRMRLDTGADVTLLSTAD
ncbi:hypothetical protein RB195_009585 [Necator americanus]